MEEEYDGDFAVDRTMYEPPQQDEIDAYVGFSTAFMEQADAEGELFEVITQWEPARIVAYQQAFFTMNVVHNPEAFGFIE